MLAALLAATLPALAQDVQFQGHSVEVGGTSGARQILRMRGSRFSIPGSPAQIVGKAQLCLSQKDSGAGVVSANPEAGQLAAISRAEYRGKGAGHSVKSKLAIEAGTGGFNLAFTDFTDIRSEPGDAANETYAPLLQQSDSGWENALSVAIGVEQKLLDCMFR